MEEANGNRHCRICGYDKFNKAQYVHDLSERIGWYRVLISDSLVDRLIRPCECRGDFEFAHKICLAEWIETSKHEYCDICRFKYNVRSHERSLAEWISQTKQVHAILKVICCCTLVYYLSSLGILSAGGRRASSVVALVVFASACIWSIFVSLFACLYAVWLFREFTCWRRANKRVEVGENTAPQLDEQSGPKDVLRFSGFRRR